MHTPHPPQHSVRKDTTRVFEGGGGEKGHPLGQAQHDGERGVRGRRDDEGALEEGGQRAWQMLESTLEHTALRSEVGRRYTCALYAQRGAAERRP